MGNRNNPSLELPDEESVAEGLLYANIDIFGLEDVRMFLSERKLEKSLIDRFVCWLVALKVIPPQKNQWCTRIYEVVNKYINLIEQFCPGAPHTPLFFLSKSDEMAIEADIMRTYNWYSDVARGLNVHQESIEFAYTSMLRIFTLMTLSCEHYSYTQGDDRYVSIFLALAQNFVHFCKLPYIVAEALTYYMTYFILFCIPVRTKIEHREQIESHYQVLDEVISHAAVDVFKRMKANSSTSLLIALRWELLLFADEHTTVNLMYIWDNVLLRLDMICEYSKSLVVAHLMQVVFDGTDPTLFNETVSSFRKWDALKAVSDSIVIMEHKRTNTETCCYYCCPRIKKYHGYQIEFD